MSNRGSDLGTRLTRILGKVGQTAVPAPPRAHATAESTTVATPPALQQHIARILELLDQQLLPRSGAIQGKLRRHDYQRVSGLGGKGDERKYD